MNRCRCIPAGGGGKTGFLNVAYKLRFSVGLRNERRKSRRDNGLGHGRQGRRQAESPPIPPRSIADYCHIHPWIFSPL
jgi:hypothetical protein